MAEVTTRRLVCVERGRVDWQEVRLEEPASGQLRVKVQNGAEKHGTMMAFYKGYGNDRGRWDAVHHRHVDEGELWKYPIPLGNLQVGLVESAGEGVSDFAEGDRICFSGPFQPIQNVSAASARKLKASTTWQAATLLDPAEFAFGALRDGNARIGERIVIFGMGAIGLVTVQLAKASGASQIIAVDPLAHRREAARRCGATHVIDPTAGPAGPAIREINGGFGVDLAIEFSGSRHGLHAALQSVGYLGTVVCGAFPAPYDAGLDLGGEAHMNRPKIVFTRACSDPNPEHPRWDWKRIQDACFDLINIGAIQDHGLVDPIVRFDELLTVYPEIAPNPAGCIKLGVRY